MLEMTCSALDQFMSYVHTIPQYSDEQRFSFAHLARQGDHQARQALIESLLPILVKYARPCAAQCRHLTLLDIVQVGVESLLRRLDHALQQSCPHAVLLKFAYWDIRKWCHQYDSSVSTPLIADSYAILSLDKPLSEDRKTTLADLLPDVSDGPVADIQDHIGLYEALARLSEEQRILLARRYGLLGYAPTPRCELARELFPHLPGDQARGILFNREKRALAALRAALSTASLPESEKTPGECYTVADLRARYGIQKSLVRYWVEQGRLMRYAAPPGTPGNVQYVYARAEVEELLHQQEGVSSVA